MRSKRSSIMQSRAVARVSILNSSMYRRSLKDMVRTIELVPNGNDAVSYSHLGVIYLSSRSGTPAGSHVKKGLRYTGRFYFVFRAGKKGVWQGLSAFP